MFRKGSRFQHYCYFPIYRLFVLNKFFFLFHMAGRFEESFRGINQLPSTLKMIMMGQSSIIQLSNNRFHTKSIDNYIFSLELPRNRNAPKYCLLILFYDICLFYRDQLIIYFQFYQDDLILIIHHVLPPRNGQIFLKTNKFL